jgi:membrane associated rhomboid family serine protease
VIPLKDDNPTSHTPVVTILLIGICAFIYFFVQPGGSLAASNATDKGARDLRFTLDHAAIPCELVKGRPLSIDEIRQTLETGNKDACLSHPETQPAFPSKSIYLAVLYSMFLHGSLLHLGGNMLFLWIFGNNIEDKLGKPGYIAFYVIAGLAAAATYVALDPNGTVPIIGASGAIAGVMGAYMVVFPNVRIRTLFIFFFILFRDIQAKWLLLFWFVLQFFTGPNSGVAWTAHVGGFVFGMLAGLVMRARGMGRPRVSAAAW